MKISNIDLWKLQILTSDFNEEKYCPSTVDLREFSNFKTQCFAVKLTCHTFLFTIKNVGINVTGRANLVYLLI